jgi:ribosome-associated protein
MTLIHEAGAAARHKAALRLVENANAPLEARRPAERGDAPGGLALLDDQERSKKILAIILAELDDDKAEDVVTIPLAGKSDIADHMVVASGRSQRHVGAMADKILRKLKETGFDRARIEGAPACDWVLIDAGYVIAHVFRPEVRRFYNLERIWSEAAHAPARSDP